MKLLSDQWYNLGQGIGFRLDLVSGALQLVFCGGFLFGGGEREK